MLENIAIPENFTRESYKKLRNIWESNHEELLRYIQKTEIPFFGLHGTKKENLIKILDEEKGYFNVATFYDKKNDEMRLYQWYNMCSYASAYTKSIQDGKYSGGILIFNLEENDKNITLPWEKLIYRFDFLLQEDSPIQKKFLKEADKKENQLWRSDITFNPENFSKYNKGYYVIPEKYNKKFPEEYPSKMRNIILRNRIKNQDILSNVLRKICYKTMPTAMCKS